MVVIYAPTPTSAGVPPPWLVAALHANTNGCRHHTLTPPPPGEFANTMGGGKSYWYSTSKHHQLHCNFINLHCSYERRLIFAIEIALISGTHGADSLPLVGSSQPGTACR